MYPRLGLASLVLAALFGTASTHPLPAQAPPTDGADLLARVRASGLESATDRITVFYPKGQTDRALEARTRVQEALAFFADSLGVAPELSLAVLDRGHWERLGIQQPYGIPGVDGVPPVAFLPATDDGLAATDALSIAAGVGDSARRLLAAAGTDWTTAASSHVALVGLHELGHALVDAYGIEVRSRWLNEWLATYAGYTFMRAHRPREALVWEGVLHGFRDAARPAHRTLAAFDRLYFGVGALNYVWYQARFQQQVQAVHAQHGLDFLRQVRAGFPRGSAPVTSADEVLTRLERIAPGFSAWAATMR